MVDATNPEPGRRWGLILLVAVAGVAAVTAAVAFWPRVDEADLPRADGVLAIGTTDFAWETSPAAYGWAMDQVSADGIMYVLSTAPGARWEQFPGGNLPEAIYTSTDGVTWASHAVGGTWIESLAASGGVLHGIGFAPGDEAGELVAQVGTSTDRGKSFATTRLPFPRVDGGWAEARVVALGQTVLALVTLTETIDLISLLPPEAQAEDGFPLILPDRVGVFPVQKAGAVDLACFTGDREEWGRQPECLAYFETDATYTATWEEIGLEDMAPVDMGQGGERNLGEEVTRRAFLSTDGSPFEAVEHELAQSWPESVATVGEFAVANTWNGGLAASDDLVTWVPIARDIAVGWVVDVGVMGDEYVLIGTSPEGDKPVVYRTDDLFGAWEPVDIGVLLPDVDNQTTFMWVNSGAVGPSGVAISFGAQFGESEPGLLSGLIGRIFPGAGDAESGETSFLLVSADLAEWNVVTTEDIGGAIAGVSISPQGGLVVTAHGPGGEPFAAVAPLDG